MYPFTNYPLGKHGIGSRAKINKCTNRFPKKVFIITCSNSNGSRTIAMIRQKRGQNFNLLQNEQTTVAFRLMDNSVQKCIPPTQMFFIN